MPLMQNLRQKSRSWIGYALGALLMVMFGAWGISDFLSPRANPGAAVITVGDVNISGQQFEAEYRRAVERYEQQLNTTLDYRTAKLLGVVNQVASSLAQGALYDLAAKDLGLTASAETLLRDIQNTTAFQINGTFDRRTYTNALANARLSPAGYEQLRRQELIRDQLLQSVASLNHVPDAYVKRLYSFLYEKRTFDVAFVLAAAIKEVPKPTDADLEKFHKDHAKDFTAPEYRKLTIVGIKAADFFKTVAVSDEDVAKSYEARQREFAEPEKRTVLQFIVKDEATAKKAEAELKEGKSFDEVSKAHSNGAPIPLGKVARAELPAPENVRELVFKLAKDAVSAPAQSPLGWHLFKVTEIEPEKVKPLAEVKPQVLNDLQRRAGAKAFEKLRDELDDLLGGGNKLEEIAEKLKLKLVKVDAIDGKGKTPKGEDFKDIPEGNILAKAFETKQGTDSGVVTQQDTSFWVVRVEEVTPSALKPLDQVKPAVTTAWENGERTKLAKAEVDKLVEQAKGGKFAEVTKAAGLTVKTTKPLTRADQVNVEDNLSQSLQDKLFDAKKDDVVWAEVPGGYAFGVVREITAIEANPADENYKKLKTSMQNSLNNESVQEFLAVMRTKFPIRIDEKAIDALFMQR
ncbi:MAG: SurA N-terminal domain-containing protein [Alphaproteobacteria bacterium]